jgi:ribosomal protein S18 acetylase RimI-like enzyme
METDVRIRPCRPEECPAVLGLWRDAEAVPSATDTPAELARVVRDNGDLFLVAEADGRLVGTVIGGWDGWRGNVYRLAVLPSHRRRGIARALVREVERRLVARGARRLSILVAGDDVQAVTFWDSLAGLGYRRDPTMGRYIRNAREPGLSDGGD